MMFKIDKNNTLWLTRSDSAYIALNVTTADGNSYTLADDDIVVMTVKASTRVSDKLLQVTLTDGQFYIAPKDTESLKYNTYVYDVQLTQSNGDVFTVIAPSKFVLCEEVSF